MSLTIVLPIMITGMIVLGMTFIDANAELNPNRAFVLDGSGFAVTETSIKISELDFAIATGNQRGSTINMLIEDGFLTINNDEFLVADLQASGLREGRYIRVSGTAENDFGEQISFRFFGRLVENSAQGSIYGFTGSLTFDGEKHKVIYTTSLTGLTNTPLPTEAKTMQETGKKVLILQGSSNRGIASSYIDVAEKQQDSIKDRGGSGLRLNYFSPTRLTIEPGTSVTFVNQDTVPHRIVSGTGLGSHSRASQGSVVICETPQKEVRLGGNYVQNECTFSFDGRIDSGIIEPGKSWTGTFKDMGFYRIIDPNYPWMSIVVYSFPDTGSEVIRSVGNKQKGN
ncbi:MAG TPA: hypothetical protein VFG25_02635 [Nitrosopumilaceae archaeon]|nr:hypothetical protein [Nitrosopumilaceae archaeon]